MLWNESEEETVSGYPYPLDKELAEKMMTYGIAK